MKLAGSVALVTGANRGLGRAFVDALLQAGVSRIHAAARDPASVDRSDPRIEPLRLDVTRPDDVEAAAATLRDVSIVVNNAGIIRGSGLLSPGGVEAVRAELETNFYGPLLVSRALAPILASHGGGAIVNVLSALSWVSFPSSSTYSVSKAAAWSLSNGLRNELLGQGTQVLSLHVGYMDTDMVRHVAAPKSSPADVARLALEALEAGRSEILADEVSRRLKQGLSAEPGVYLLPPPG